jgi:hypothetical protein
MCSLRPEVKVVVVVVEILTAAPSDVPEEWVDLAAAAVLDFRLVEAAFGGGGGGSILTPAVKAALAVAAAAALAGTGGAGAVILYIGRMDIDMRKAWIENERIRDIAHSEPTEIYHPDVAVFYDTEVPDDAENGDGWIDGVLVKAGA